MTGATASAPDVFDLADPETLGFSSVRLNRIADWNSRFVESGQLAGTSVLICRPDRGVWYHAAGQSALDSARRMQEDTICRIYSMTKPITSVALMMLYEAGSFHLDDPVSTYLSEFAATQVYVAGSDHIPILEDVRRPITIRDLLTHTSGLVHPFRGDSPVHAIYRAKGIDFGRGQGDLAEMTRQLGSLPLLFQPGTRWHYGVSTDVIGRLIEVLSGQQLNDYFEQQIFAPLGMSDTAFAVAPQNLGRLATLYTLAGADSEPAGDKLVPIDPAEASHFASQVSLFSGGGGLTSTIGDYLRFALMLRNGGELGGVRLLGRKTIDFMRQNHLPGTMADLGEPRFGDDMHLGSGLGFGLGFAVVLDPTAAQVMGSRGEYFWPGVGGTQFWIDPVEDLIVIQMAQMRPASLVPTRRTLRSLVYQALE